MPTAKKALGAQGVAVPFTISDEDALKLNTEAGQLA